MFTSTELQDAVITVLNSPSPEHCDALQRFSAKQWRNVYWWLDSAGLTLPLAARLLGEPCPIPEDVARRFEANLRDNAQRTTDMLKHFGAVNAALVNEGIPFAVQKGFSGHPDYWSDPYLRLQLDLDYLVDRTNAERTARVLKRFDYSLVEADNREWKFETIPGVVLDHEDVYKPSVARSIELHFEVFDAIIMAGTRQEPLQHLESREAFGLEFPVLGASDFFLQQAMHAFCHLVNYSVRLSHLREIAFFVANHSDNDALWDELRDRTACNPRIGKAIGIVLAITNTTFPFGVPSALADWTTAALHASTKSWVDLFGKRWCLEPMPGSKIALLVLREVIANDDWRRLVRDKLILLRAPHNPYRHAEGSPGRRNMVAQVRFYERRVWFHVRELFRFAAAYVRLSICAKYSRCAPATGPAD